MYCNRFIHPWHGKQVASTQIFFANRAAINDRLPDLIAEHLIKIAGLRSKPVVDKGLRISAVVGNG